MGAVSRETNLSSHFSVVDRLTLFCCRFLHMADFLSPELLETSFRHKVQSKVTLLLLGKPRGGEVPLHGMEKSDSQTYLELEMSAAISSLSLDQRFQAYVLGF